jgi:flagellar motility protein MotE (MotC chaperone)
MRLSVPAPRLLPATIVAMAALLAMKSAVLVRAAVPIIADAMPASAAQAAQPPAAPAPAPPAPASLVSALPVPASPAPTPTPPSPQAAPPDDEQGSLQPPISDSERALLVDLRRRRDEIDARERELDARAEVLAAAERRLATRVDELTALESRLKALEAARKEHDEANWKGLVKLYESMKPRDAAAIFNDLDLATLLPIVDRMKDLKAAPVLAAMEPDRARRLTSELARMRAKANTAAGGDGHG